jgi:hypothetical protein
MRIWSDGDLSIFNFTSFNLMPVNRERKTGNKLDLPSFRKSETAIKH